MTDSSFMSIQRVFIGWNEPFGRLAADWLLSQKQGLEDSLVLVPTAQSARQLRQRMAQGAGAVLSPHFSTPGALMHMNDPEIAPDWLEIVAWQEILEHQTGSETLSCLFSGSAHTRGEWAGDLASEMLALRRSLQDNGLMIRDLARRLSSSPEAARWEALARVESKVESWIRKQGQCSRSEKIKGGLVMPSQTQSIILAGITELPPITQHCLIESGLPITALIAAPESEKERFNDMGLPNESWTQAFISWPDSNGAVSVTSDPKQQAHQARRLIATNQTQIHDLTLGSADVETGDLLAEELSMAGWPTYHPASIVPQHGLRRWLLTWKQWLLQPDLSSLADLLTLSFTQALIGADCAAIAHSLAQLRDRWMVLQVDDLRHQLKHSNHRRLKIEAVDVIRICEKLEHWRRLCEGEDLSGSLRHLLDALNTEDEDLAEIHSWLDEATEQMNQSQRSMSFWIGIMINHLSRPSADLPDHRVLDVHGWLELMFQPGQHLIICGMNEGRIPTSKTDDPWLGESTRKILGLHTNGSRWARDAFLLQSMIQSRIQSGGRVDLMCSRNNQKGEPLLPSRLLLAGDMKEIPSRVEILFEELEPTDAKLRWNIETNAAWRPPAIEGPDTLSATSFRDYLACPFRYRLKHLHRMRSSEPDRIEWNARDFGIVMHDVLEAWGRDECAKELSSATDIEHWLNKELDQRIQHAFNQRIPLAVRIQLDAMRQRLAWFARAQENLMMNGWRVMDVELNLTTPIEGARITTKIDRIDRNLDSGDIRVIDYKTGGKEKTTCAAHRTKQNASSRLPIHINDDDPAIYERTDGKKIASYLWRDLQLPLYVHAIHYRDQQLATPCYFKLGETIKDVELRPWHDFDEQDLAAAITCAEWVSNCISREQFSPIAEKPRYDDYSMLWCDRLPEQVMGGLVKK